MVSFINLDRFNVFRADRCFELSGSHRGGGVLLAVGASFGVSVMDLGSVLPGLGYVNVVAVVVDLGFCRLYVIVLYVRPSCTVMEYRVLFDALMTVVGVLDGRVLILGDFNIPDLIRHYDGQQSTALVGEFVNFIEFCGLDQYNRVVNGNGRLLDLVITNFTCSVERSDRILLPEDSHHPALELSFSAVSPSRPFPVMCSSEYNFKKANFVDLYESLSLLDWNLPELSGLGVDDAVERFYGSLSGVLDLYVPKKKRTSRTYPPGSLVKL